ncbi:MAG: Bax inhibitor-1/YccA family protein [Alphaproteobacteria bacterium]|nr:Bax inhibitor-1/YccA family protein [Alphaproteobacteria bacterium]
MNSNPFSQTTQTRALAQDAGLRAHMQRVYNRMTVGVLLTGLTAWFVSSSPALMSLFMGGPQAYVIMLAPLAVIWFGFRPQTMSHKALMAVFGLLCVLYGISFSTIFAVFTGESIARAFFMATALYAGLSVFGYVTKKNLDGLGTFAVMGVWAVLILAVGTMIAGAFGVETSMMQSIISGIGLIAFSGITAWQTQTTKEMYSSAYSDDANSRMGWAAALNLYVSFIAIFQYILHFVGQRE